MKKRNCNKCYFFCDVYCSCDFCYKTGKRRGTAPEECKRYLPRKWTKGRRARQILIITGTGKIYDVQPMKEGKLPLLHTAWGYIQAKKPISTEQLETAIQVS